ncbi:hypothetical protein TWF481_009756 [Arthrobotrys musiformis]|uniref:NACHT domain-containing protein n=1 Tax=Arthrobotrys musiformis TaxID=47236 RepID=A0AAV9W5V5_9PEZI
MNPATVTFNNANNGGNFAIQAGSFNNPGTINFINKDDAEAARRREKEIKILRDLYKSVEKNRKDRNPTPVPGTCEWFTHHEVFQEWKTSSESKLLWVSADPGSGKSVLARYLVDTILPTDDTSCRTICYFFFKDDFEGQNSVATALCCILWELFEKKRSLLSKEILERFEIEGDGFPSSVTGLWNIFMMVAKNEAAGEIVCVLDALDECKRSDREFLIEKFKQLYNATYNRKLKFLITSRPIFEIRDGFHSQNFPESSLIHLNGESDIEVAKISQEISIFIEFRARGIAKRFGLTNEETDMLLRKLNEVPNRTYLWVYLTLDLIEGDASRNLWFGEERITKITSQLPASVDEAYERILSASHDIEQAKLMLQILVAAERPLHLREIILAMQLAVDDRPHNSYQGLRMVLERPEQQICDRIRDLCGLFVAVIDSAVYLIHQTAKEFLLGSGESHLIRSTGQAFRWKNSLEVSDCNRILFYICVRHLFFSEFESDPYIPEQPHRIGSLYASTVVQSAREYLERYLFLDYSANQWAIHFRNADIELSQGEIDWVLKLCDADSNRLLTWFGVYWATNVNAVDAKFPKGLTTLIVVSYFGLRPMVKHFLDSELGRNSNVNARDIVYGRSALTWAVGNGFKDAAEELLKRGYQTAPPFYRMGAKIDLADRQWRTPLMYAIFRGHTLIIELLLKAGASAYHRDDLNMTPFSYAIYSRNKGYREDFVGYQGLMDGGWIAEKSCISVKLGPPWVRPGTRPVKLEEGRDYALKMLVETGRANLEVRNLSGVTALSWYAGLGELRKVRYLLEWGADIEAGDEDSWTPLIWAACQGHTDTVELLLERGADIEARSKKGATPLILAASGRRIDVVKLLLENGADIEAKDRNGWTPLIWAAGGDPEREIPGNADTVELLLENGADIDAKDGDGLTSLMWAVCKEDADMVKLLLEKGAVCLADDMGGWLTLLERVSFKHQWEPKKYDWGLPIRALRDGGRDLDAVLEDGTTLLGWAVQRGFKHLVRPLLENGANPNVANADGRTSLHFAFDFRFLNFSRTEVLSLLLDSGADTEATDCNGETPILLLTRHGDRFPETQFADMLPLLLSRGANARAADYDGFTPLFRAVDSPSKGLRRACELLMENGAETATRIIRGEPHSLLYKVISHQLESYEDWREYDPELRRSQAEAAHGDLVNFLLDKGADIEERSKLGPTPLFHALGVGNQIAVSLLLARGARTEVKGVNGKAIRVLFHPEPPHDESSHLGSITLAAAPPIPPCQPDFDTGLALTLAPVPQRGHVVSKIEVPDEEGGPWITTSIDKIDGSDYL